MKIISTELQFKGTRDYLHGTDMYIELIRVLNNRYSLAESRSLRLNINKFGKYQFDIHFKEPTDGPGKPEKATADFLLTLPEESISGWFVQSSRPVESRYPYNEDAVFEHCVIKEQSISIHRDPGYHPVEVAVAMTKHLHESQLPLDDKRWVLTKLHITRLFQSIDASSLVIKLDHNIGTRLSRSTITATDGLIGQIYMSAAPKF